MLRLLSLLLACAGSPEVTPDAAPASDAPREAAPASDAPREAASAALTLNSMRQECGPNDGVLLRVRAQTAAGVSVSFDLPSSPEAGPMAFVPAWLYPEPGPATPLEASGVVHSYSEGRLKATLSVTELEGRPAELLVDGEVEPITELCG